MIKNKNLAKKINKLSLDFGKSLNEILVTVQQECSQEEFDLCRDSVGKVMGELLLEIMNPIYSEHPELKPDELE